MSQIYKSTTGGGGGGPLLTLTGDTGGAISPDAGGNINTLGQPDLNIAGNAGTNTLTATDLTKITPYVVDGSLTAGTEVAYSTIQSAINAANAAGGGMVYVKPGSYTENLTFFDNIQVVSVEYVDIGDTVITGVHTPPATGAIAIRGIRLMSATSIFSSVVAGSANISILECTFGVTDGYVFDLPNWTGTFNINDCGSQPGTNDGVINNSAGAAIFTNNCQIGAGTTRTFTANGNVRLDLTFLNCPGDISAGTLFINLALFSQTLTLSGTAGGNIFLGDFFTGASTALVMNSSSNINVFNCTFNTSATNAISGSGSGSIFFGENAYLDSQQIGPSVITPNLLHSVSGSGQTVDVGTVDLITYTLRDVVSAYQFEALISGISVAGSAVGVQLTGMIKTDSVNASIVGTVDQIFNADLAIAGASIAAIASGNTLIIRATGSLGSVINWGINLTFKHKTN